MNCKNDALSPYSIRDQTQKYDQNKYDDGAEDENGESRRKNRVEYGGHIPSENGGAETERDEPADDGKREEIIPHRNFSLRPYQHGE
jgi:hypothetical protein